MKFLRGSLFQAVSAFLQLLMLLGFSTASPLTLNGAKQLSRDAHETSQSPRSTRLEYANLLANQIPANSKARPRTTPSRYLTLASPLPPHVRTLTYEVPMTNIAIDFALYDNHPLDRDALRLAIHSGQQWLRAHLAAHGDDWLAPTHNPFTSSIHGQCYIRVISLKAPNGRSLMTYKTVLAIYDAYAEVFVEQGNEVEGVMRMIVANIIVGHGLVTAENPVPDFIKNGTVSDV